MPTDTVPAKTIDTAPARAAFEKALAEHKQDFGHFFLLHLLGMQVSYGENDCTVELDVHDYLFNPQGSMHGGIAATMMDISMGHLMDHTCGRGVTLELKVQYMKGLTSGRIRAVGTFLKRGRSICFTESRLYDADGDLAAVATATWKLHKPPKDA